MIYLILLLITSAAFIATAAMLAMGSALGARPIARSCGGNGPCDCASKRECRKPDPLEPGVPDS